MPWASAVCCGFGAAVNSAGRTLDDTQWFWKRSPSRASCAEQPILVLCARIATARGIARKFGLREDLQMRELDHIVVDGEVSREARQPQGRLRLIAGAPSGGSSLE